MELCYLFVVAGGIVWLFMIVAVATVVVVLAAIKLKKGKPQTQHTA